MSVMKSGHSRLMGILQLEMVRAESGVIGVFYHRLRLPAPIIRRISFSTSRHIAEHYAPKLPPAVLAAPIEFPEMRFYKLWHSRT